MKRARSVMTIQNELEPLIARAAAALPKVRAVTSPLSSNIFGRVVLRFTLAAFESEAQLRLLRTGGLRDALIAASTAAASRSSAEAWCRAMDSLVGLDDLFVTGGVRDAMAAVGRHVATRAGCQSFLTALRHLVCNQDRARFFATAPIRDAMIAVSAVVTKETCVDWTDALGMMARLDSERVRVMLGTQSMKNALVAVSEHVDSSNGCMRWCAVLGLLSRSPQNVQLFGSCAAVRDALVSMSRHALNCTDAATMWCLSIELLTETDRRNQRLFRTIAVRDALIAVRPFANCDLAPAGSNVARLFRRR